MAWAESSSRTDRGLNCFVIHNHSDQKAAYELGQIIEKNGFRLFTENFPATDDVKLPLIEKADCIVILITSNKVKDLGHFFDKHEGRQFISVVYKPIEDSEVTEEPDLESLKRCQIIKAHTFNDDQFQEDLIRTMKSHQIDLLPDTESNMDSRACETILDTSTTFAHVYLNDATRPPEHFPVGETSPVMQTITHIMPTTCLLPSNFVLDPSLPGTRLTSDRSIRNSDSRVEQMKNENSALVVRKLFEWDVADKYKHFITAFKNQRFPWLVPVLEIVDEPRYKFQLVNPYMLGGNLQRFLNDGISDDMNRRDVLLTIMYQISEGVTSLHERNVVHGALNLHHILLDEHGNVRLTDYGMYTCSSGAEGISSRQSGAVDVVNLSKCFRVDLNSFGRIIAQMLALSSDDVDNLVRQFNTFLKSRNYESVSSASFTLDDNNIAKAYLYIDQNTWPRDLTTLEAIHVSLAAISPECSGKTSRKITEKLKLMIINLQLPRILVKQGSTNCLYCTTQPIHSELRLRSSNCSETCPFTRTCICCMQYYGSPFHVDNDVCTHGRSATNSDVLCPIHNGPIEPVIGGKKAFALILYDETNQGFKRDATRMTKLSSHPMVMRIPFRNIRRYCLPKPTKANKIEEAHNRIQEEMHYIRDQEPSFFLFFFSGHQLLERTQNVSLYKDLVQMLRHYINQIAKTCPRILMIFDCCQASAVADLFAIKLNDDSHVEWHVQWASSRRKEQSSIEPFQPLSAFTGLLVSALKGGTAERRCPNGGEDCSECLKYGESCSRKGYVSLTAARDFVHEHISRRPRKTQENPGDVQQPIVKIVSDCEPILSWFNPDPFLYTILRRKSDGTVEKCLTDGVDKTSIWRIAAGLHTSDYVEFRKRPTQKELRKGSCVDVYERYVESPLFHFNVTDDKSDDDGPILEALSKNKCLLVKIRDSQDSHQDSHLPVQLEDSG